MKDVELIASVLLLIEEGPKSYSQDDLDKAFSDRDAVWEKKLEVVHLFRAMADAVNKIVRYQPQSGPPLAKTRLRNQTDFYSLCGAISDLIQDDKLPPVEAAADKLWNFLQQVDDEELRMLNTAAKDYYEAARSASNDAGPRSVRIQKIKEVLLA